MNKRAQALRDKPWQHVKRAPAFDIPAGESVFVQLDYAMQRKNMVDRVRKFRRRTGIKLKAKMLGTGVRIFNEEEL